jgi:hypothetical protein
MSTRTPGRSRAEADRREGEWASGFALFASVMMLLAGTNQAIHGFAAILENEVYVPVRDDVYGLDLTAWGWLHLGFGVVLVLTGLAVIRGNTWARAVGILVAMLGLVASFGFIPYYPVWAVLLIGLDLAVIWGQARFDGKVR